jgi:hypothetical protein
LIYFLRLPRYRKSFYLSFWRGHSNWESKTIWCSFDIMADTLSISIHNDVFAIFCTFVLSSWCMNVHNTEE